MDRIATKLTRAQAIGVVAASIGLLAIIGGAVWRISSGPTDVLMVGPETRLLTISQGKAYWVGRDCHLWNAKIENGRATTEPLEPVGRPGCAPDDPRFDGDVIYALNGLGYVLRTSPKWRGPILERTLLYALAIDSKYVYVGNCSVRDDCHIERLPISDGPPPDQGPGDPILMQAGIHALANMDVDQKEIFWVDRGRHKKICADETNVDTNEVEYHCHDPVPPRLMAANKDEPRAEERVVLSDFDGRRPLLGARHVYWLGAGGVHRVLKVGGANQLVLPTHALSGFAAEGNDVYFAADDGIFQARDGETVKLLQRTAHPPRGVAVDADFVYWIDVDREMIVRKRR